jgi:hypothetical protein
MWTTIEQLLPGDTLPVPRKCAEDKIHPYEPHQSCYD